MNTLRKSLLGNAIFSAVSGILLILFHEYAAHLFGMSGSRAFWIIGFLLLPFALSVFVEVRRERLTNVLFIILQDGLWVLGSAVLLVFQPFGISPAGNWMIGTVAAVVLGFGVAQSIGILQTDSGSVYSRKKLAFGRKVAAPKSEAWDLISEVSDYHSVAPNVEGVEILSGAGEGMVRRCLNGDGQWTETCTEWKEGQRFVFEVDTSAPDYPYPFSSFKGAWEVEEAATDISSTIRMEFEFDYGQSLYALLLHPFIKKKFNRVCRELLDNWEWRLAERQSVNA